MAKYWISLYDSNDKFIAGYRVWSNTKLDILLESAALSYRNIEYIKIKLNPPDESIDETR